MWRKRWVRIATMLVFAVAVVSAGVLSYYYVSFSRLIDQSLHGERDKVFPQVFARPLDLYRGQSLTGPQLLDRLNDLGYAQRTKPEKPGEFTITNTNNGALQTFSLIPRVRELQGQVV